MPAFRKNVTGNVTTANKYLATPVDWLATFSIAVINAANEYHYLLTKMLTLSVNPTQIRTLRSMQNLSITLFLTITPLF
jgi:hypothetical protein